MPKVIIIPDSQVENVCRDAVNFANNCQSDFTFYLIPQTRTHNSPLGKPNAEVFYILEYLNNLKKQHNYEIEDLVLTFYNGILNETGQGLSNLFFAGSNIVDKYPCTGIISLKYLGWNVLEEKYNYEVQKHSILHLIVCGVIGSYTRLMPHNDIGCLLDFNMVLTSFNLKLQKGYYLCSKIEYGCYDKIKDEKYGNSIIRLCEKFKSTNYQTIINEIIMGDKIQVGNISNNTGQIAIGKNIRVSTSEDDRKNLLVKIEELIKMIRQENIPEDSKQTIITNFDKVREEIQDEKDPDKSRIVKWLTNTKKAIEYVVLTHEASQAINWIYKGLNFLA